MKGTFVLSALIHFALLSVLIYLPEWTHRQAVYTPVYTVDLLTLPPARKTHRHRKKAIRPARKTHPHKKKAIRPLLKKKARLKPAKRRRLNFSPPPQSDDLLKKLEKFTRNIKKAGQKEKRKDKIKETALSDMLTAFEKKWERKQGGDVLSRPSAEAKAKKGLLERLKRLEEKWSAPAEEEAGKSAARTGDEPFPARLKKKVQLRQANVKSQTAAPVVSPLLNRYYARVLSRIRENWQDPLSTKPPKSIQNIPGVAYFEIMPTGVVARVRIEESSGDKLYDSLLKKAIEDSSPLPPPPVQLSAGGLKIFLDFNYVFAK